MKKIAGIFLVILGILMFGYAIWWSPLNPFGSPQSNLEKKLPIKDIDSIELDVTSEDLTIVPTDDKNLKVIASGRNLNRVHFEINQVDNQVTIHMKPKWYLFSNTNELNLLVYVPRNQQIKLSTKTKSRVVNIGDNKGTKWNIANLDAEVSGGTCNLHNLKLGYFTYNGISSDVMMDRVYASKATMDSSTGNMNIRRYTGPLHLSSTSGNIRIQVDQLLGNIHTEMIAGDLNLYLPSSSSFTLKSQIKSGKLTAIYPLKLNKLSSMLTTAKSGSGKYKIDTEIANGDFIIH